jgi:type IV pilus assembly protein PilW
MRFPKSAPRGRQAGLSLVEVMVAVLIGLIGILIITQAYITGDRFNRSTLGEGGAQTNGLIALYSMERDVRLAGYGIANSNVLGCGLAHWYYNGTYATVDGGTLPDIRVAPVVITVTAGAADKVTVLYGGESERVMPTMVTAFSSAANEATVDGVAGFLNNDVLMFFGAGGCTFAKVTDVLPGQQKVQMTAGTLNPPGWASFPGYAGGDLVFNLGANPVLREYSIVNNKLRLSEGLLQAGAVTNLDLVDGIMDLRAQYGKDTNGDGVVDAWNNVLPTNSAEWQQVQALRTAVLSRIGNYEKPSSGTDCDITTTANAPSWSGGAFDTLDLATAASLDRCYRYRVFETTIPLRNMIWRSS